ERELLLKTLRGCGRRFRFRAEVANTFNLRMLLNSGCDLLHFSGHGNEEFLAFESSLESKCGLEEPLAVEPLKKMLQPGGMNTKLVFINSCCSELSGNAFAEAGVPHVIAVKEVKSISDQAARHFSELFYDALIQDGGKFTVKQAFDIACNTVNTTDSRGPPCEGNHFLLLPKDGDHNVRIFGTLQEGELADESRPLPPRPPSCKRAVSSYKGLRELQQLVSLLVDTSAACVTVTGENGSGKTERAIQACDYVRERHHFEAYHWADCDKTVMEATDAAALCPPHCPLDSALEDPCRLIGIAIGMASPGPASEEELLRFLFQDPMKGAGRQCQKVLLVLENVDSLFERGDDAQDRLVTLLSNLCSVGGGRHLKLLVTSEQRLQPGTDARFRSGPEVEAKVEPLRRRDAAKLLVENLPRTLTKTDLGLQTCVTRDGLLQVVQEHAVLKEILDRADGHPGTLLALAPKILDVDARTLYEMADTRHRQSFRGKDYRQRRHRRGSSGNSAICISRGHRRVSSGNSVTCRSPSGSPMAPRPLPFVGQAFSADAACPRNRSHCVCTPRDHGGNSSGGGQGASAAGRTTPPLSAFPGASPLEENPRAHTNSPAHCERACCREQPSPPRPSPCCRHYQSQLQRRRAETATVTTRRRRSAPGALEGELEPPQLTPEEQRSWHQALEMGVTDAECRLVWATAGVSDTLASWECLQERLMEHLRGKMTVPTRRCRREPGFDFIRNFLRLRSDPRPQPEAHLDPGSSNNRRNRGAPHVEGGDLISLKAFQKFSRWWAPVVATVSRVRKDWESTEPVRIHGFIRRFAAERMLLRRGKPGTFLLRFSGSEAGALVVSFTERAVS
ncbi:unnamed protein product, partial [Scytosiphon promiscuus]